MTRKVLIVGGGTAGWMTAAYLAKALPELHVSLIESSRVQRIGVGEATFSTVRHFFDYLGLNESEWLPKCAGGYKLGIKFENWSGDGSSFVHPFERWNSVRGFSMAEWWLAQSPQHRGAFDRETFVTPHICDALRAPRSLDGEMYVSGDENLGESTLLDQREQFPYAYHFDADRVAGFLSDYARDRGVTHIIDDVTAVETAEGEITGVQTAASGVLDADLYVDCTGFRSMLLNGALEEPFVSFSDVLPNNRAVALRAPRAVLEDMEPYTTATTMSSGWRWTIPLYKRNGYGYVYCDQYITPDEAEAELRASLPVPTEDIPANHIRMRIGRARSAWVSNCVGIGLSAAFVEPLESTGIFFVQQGIEELVRFFPSHQADRNAWLREEYNRRVRNMVEGVKHFLVLHFTAAQRNDTPYWRDLKNHPKTDEVGRVLQFAKYGLLDEESIYPHFHGFESYSWNTMILGLGAGPQTARPAVSIQGPDVAASEFRRIHEQVRMSIARLPSCYEYVDHLTRT